MAGQCIFCSIIARERTAHIVHETEDCLVFLDSRPLFPGHCLVATKQHVETLLDLPDPLLKPLLAAARLIARAVERGLGAEGSFVAVNNRVSQSVPHLHVHVIPRRKGDGLKGFFWPRTPYRDEKHIEEVLASLRAGVAAAGR
ncbi:MAG: HIT family protein [Acidobacteria bacterium]|nr:HIT family protein [Acidobacteriota bacterium]MBI3281314.1 HIT family protein [Acidobacteriota bacterium]